MSDKNSNWRKWLLLSEEGIVLNHVGKQMVDIVPLPSSVLEGHARKSLDSSFEGRTLQEVVSTIRDVCVGSSATYESVIEYRCSALLGLWEARRAATSAEDNDSSPSPSRREARQAEGSRTVDVPYTVKLNALLTIPLVGSLTRSDPQLRASVSSLLLASLQALRPSCLSSEPAECLQQLERLLVGWVDRDSRGSTDQRNQAASAYLALALAVNDLSMMFRVVCCLRELMGEEGEGLSVAPPPSWPALQDCGAAGLCCMAQPLLSVELQEQGAPRDTPATGCMVPSLASNGVYLYLLESSGHLLKVGTGRRGSLSGVVYHSREAPPGWLVVVDQQLLLAEAREEWTPLTWHSVHPDTLEQKSNIKSEVVFPDQATLRVLSDGHFIYQVTMLHVAPQSGRDKDQVQIRVNKLKLEKGEGKELSLQSCGSHVTLTGGDVKTSGGLSNVVRLSRSISLFGSQRESEKSPGAQSSCGLPEGVLKRSAMFVGGDCLVVLQGTTAVGRAITINMPTARREICNNVCFSLHSGKMEEVVPVLDSPTQSTAMSTAFPTADLGACYDPHRHCVWTYCKGQLDQWTCDGPLPTYRPLKSLLTTRLQGAESASRPDLDLLLYLGMESCGGNPREFLDGPDALARFHGLLEEHLASQDPLYLAPLVAILKGQLTAGNKVLLSFTGLAKLRDSLWSLLKSTQDHSLAAILVDLVSTHFDLLYKSNEDRVEVAMEIIDRVLAPPPDDGSKWTELCNTFLWRIGEDGHLVGCSVAVFARLLNHLAASPDEEPKPAKAGPTIVSPVLKAAMGILSSALQDVLCGQGPVKEETVQLLSMVVEASQQWCEGRLEKAGGGGEESKPSSKPLPCGSPSSPVTLLVMVATVVVKMDYPALHSIGHLVPGLIDLCGLTSRLCQRRLGSERLSSLRLPCPWTLGRHVESLHPVFQHYSVQHTVSFPGARELFVKFDEKCATQYSSDKLTLHVGPDTKARVAHVFGGNPLSSSPGSGGSSGGPSSGRSSGGTAAPPTSGSGGGVVPVSSWPGDVVRVEGDTVTFRLAVSSAREKGTPDKAVWGFACEVMAREDHSELGGDPLPPVVDLHCTLVVACTHLVRGLFRGSPLTAQETDLAHLLQSPLLQRCHWTEESFLTPPPRVPLPVGVISKLREVVGTSAPVMRPSMRQLIEADAVEELLVSTSIHHLELAPPIQLVGERGGPHRDLLVKMFNSLDSLLRRLMVLADLEQTWWSEVEEARGGTLELSNASFYGYLQLESTQKRFELLCLIKGINLEEVDLFSAAKQLQCKMEEDVARSPAPSPAHCPQTVRLVKSITDKAALLFSVSSVGHLGGQLQEPSSVGVVGARSGPVLERFKSVPAERLPPPVAERQPSLENFPLSRAEGEVNRDSVLSQIFDFVSSERSLKIELGDFLSAAKSQWRRGQSRLAALRHLRSLLDCAPLDLGLEQVVRGMASALQNGHCPQEVGCSGLVGTIREAFGDTLQRLVALASSQPALAMDTVALLCCAPYQRSDEESLLRSGVMRLLELLCSPSHLAEEYILSEDQEERVKTLAWGSFRVLSNTCVTWEDGRTNIASSGIARQVSAILTQNLIKAIGQWNPDDIMSCDPLHDNLTMLLGLSQSQMGRYVLSQPVCVSQLLALLVHQRPPPKLILVALKLCRISLPMMDAAECAKITLPAHLAPPRGARPSRVAQRLVRLLLRTLAEYLVVGGAEGEEVDLLGGEEDEQAGEGPADSAPTQTEPTQGKVPGDGELGGKLSVYLHRRDDQKAADVIKNVNVKQDSQLGGPSRSARPSGVDHIIAVGNALKTDKKALVFVDEKSFALRKALRWAATGSIVSLGPPCEQLALEGGLGEEKAAKLEQGCRECRTRNLELSKSSPPQAFLSGSVAQSLVSEIMALLSELVGGGQGSSGVWTTAIRQVLTEVLGSASSLTSELLQFTSTVSQQVGEGLPPPPPSTLHQTASLLNAAMATVGGFKQSFFEGAEVAISGPGLGACRGVITSLSEERGLACVQLLQDGFSFVPKDTLELPLSRLSLQGAPPIAVEEGRLLQALLEALGAVLSCPAPLLRAAPASTNGMEWSLATCRLLAELRTRSAAALLAQFRLNPSLWSSALPPALRDSLLDQAQQCPPAQRRGLTQRHARALRTLYRDAFRPPPRAQARASDQKQTYSLNTTRKWPPVHSCVFAHNMTYVGFYGNKQQGSVTLLSSLPIPVGGASFYWECHILNPGQPRDSAPPVVAMGMTPPLPIDKPSSGGVFSLAPGSCIAKSTGEACHCVGKEESSWQRSTVSPTPLPAHSVLGCGWMRAEQGDAHKVFFTVGGKRVAEFSQVPLSLTPFLQLSNYETKVVVNFGDYPFNYPEGRDYREGAYKTLPHDVTVLNQEMPFPPRDSDTEEEGEEGSHGNPSKPIPPPPPPPPVPPIGGQGKSPVPPTPEAKSNSAVEGKPLPVDGKPLPVDGKPLPVDGKPLPVETMPPGPEVIVVDSPPTILEYSASVVNRLTGRTGFDVMLETTPPGEEGAELDVGEEQQSPQSKGKEEDPYDLLVKAWESRVFPIIHQRFRNEQERKEGTEQIKGALRLGMEDIARQTVEFLYEDVGKLPKELSFPTIEEAKGKAEELSAEKLSTGQVVLVAEGLPVGACGVRMMGKTCGLAGVVLEVAEKLQIARVECYVPSDAVLVRYWYPVPCLEKPPLGHAHSPFLKAADAQQIHAHRSLLQCEAWLTSMLCREITLALTPPPQHSMDMLFAESLRGSTPFTLHLDHSPQAALNSLRVSPSHMFFHSHAPLQSCFSSGGVANLKEIVGGVSKPDALTSVTLPLGRDGKKEAELVFTGAELMLVTCQPKAISNGLPSELDEKGWIRFYCYHGSRGKHGRLKLREVLSYPQNQRSVFFGPTLLPGNRLYVRVEGSSDLAESFSAQVLGMSREFLLGLTAAEHVAQTANPDPGLVKECLASLSNTLRTRCLPAVVKETIFHLMSCLVHHLPDKVAEKGIPPDLHRALWTEFCDLYSSELEGLGHQGPPTFPSPTSFSAGGCGRFSTYLQSLFQLMHSLGAPPAASTKEGLSPRGPVGRLSAYERPLRKISRPLPIKSLSYDPDGPGLAQPDPSQEWVNDIHDSLALIEGIVSSEEISLLDLEAGLMINPQSRLLVITGFPSSQEALEAVRTLARKHGSLYLCEEGAVMETAHSSKVSALSGELLKGGEGAELKVFTLGEGLDLDHPQGSVVLDSYLTQQLTPQLLEALFSAARGGGAGRRLVGELVGGEGVESVLQLPLEGFVERMRSLNVRAVWKGLFTHGVDLHGNKCYSVDFHGSGPQARALVSYLDRRGRECGVHPVDMETWDIDPVGGVTLDSELHLLQGMSVGSLRMLFVAVRWINSRLTHLLPLMDLRSQVAGSMGGLLGRLSPYLFYDTKMTLLNRLLKASVQRAPDHAPPEVKLNPLEVINSKTPSVAESHFGQTAHQLMSVPGNQLRVQLAAGGDPTYAFNVKMLGEEVMGTSGSFRHFLGQVIRELRSPHLRILSPCPSAAAGLHKDKYILAPGELTAALEKLLVFFGQLLGIVLRADIPVPLDLMPCSWKSILGLALRREDLQDADVLSFSYCQSILQTDSQEALSSVLISEDGNECRFTTTLLSGEEVEVCPGGRDRVVSLENKEEFCSLLEARRLEELGCAARVSAVRAGLGSVVPLDSLALLTAGDLALRLCGLPHIDLAFLRRHTIYQKGISEQDAHVCYFWAALHSLSQESLKRFVKFACNQERIPSTNPNRGEDPGSLVHVPPYPMIIAPASGKGPPDKRFIRAETCMFMVKLPKYTSEEVMRDRIYDAISFREDPLVG